MLKVSKSIISIPVRINETTAAAIGTKFIISLPLTSKLKMAKGTQVHITAKINKINWRIGSKTIQGIIYHGFFFKF